MYNFSDLKKNSLKNNGCDSSNNHAPAEFLKVTHKYKLDYFILRIL